MPIFLITLLLMAGWFMFMARRQRRRLVDHDGLVRSLEPGDRIMTASGIFGTIRSMTPTRCLVDIAPGTTIEILPGAISRRVDETDGTDPVDATASGDTSSDDTGRDDSTAPDEPLLGDVAGDDPEPGPRLEKA